MGCGTGSSLHLDGVRHVEQVLPRGAESRDEDRRDIVQHEAQLESFTGPSLPQRMVQGESLHRHLHRPLHQTSNSEVIVSL